MKILPERVFVLPDLAKHELTVVMDGFRMTLSGDEARALRDGLDQGMKKLGDSRTAQSADIIGLTSGGAQDTKRAGSD